MSIEELASAAGTPTEPNASSAGTENTEQAMGSTETTVPYERMQEQVRQREAAERAVENAERRAGQAESELREMRERMASLESEVRRPKSGPEAHGIPSNLGEPPDDLTERQKVDWYIKDALSRYAPGIIREQIGDVSEYRERFKRMDEDQREREASNRQAVEQAWNNACGAHGLDPNDREVQAMAKALCSRPEQGGLGLPLEQGMKRIKAMRGGGSNGTSELTATVENTPGATGGSAPEKWLPTTPEEAAAGARQGRRATHLSSQELIDRRRAAFQRTN